MSPLEEGPSGEDNDPDHLDMPPLKEGPNKDDEDLDYLDMAPAEEGPSREEEDHMFVVDVPDDQAFINRSASLVNNSSDKEEETPMSLVNVGTANLNSPIHTAVQITKFMHRPC